MSAPLDDARAFGAAVNAGTRANIVEAQLAGRRAALAAVAPVQDALFGEAGEIQDALFEVEA